MHYLKCSVQVTVWLEFQKTYLDLQCWISSVRLSLEIPITLHVMAQLQVRNIDNTAVVIILQSAVLLVRTVSSLYYILY